MKFPLLSAQELYTRQEEYEQEIDPSWDEENYRESEPEELCQLSAVLGAGEGKSVLDCSCGGGCQAIPLAKLGWQVTATDVTEISIRKARKRAESMGLAIRFQACDMRDLDQHFRAEFDQVVTCMALDNITEDEGIRQAVQGMFSALKPGGKLYIRLRDFDKLMSDRPRYEFRFERPLPYGKLYAMQDWVYESGTHVIMVYVYWLHDLRKTGYPWSDAIFAFRRRALRKAELEAFLREAGFKTVEFLPQPSPWHPFEVVAGA